MSRESVPEADMQALLDTAAPRPAWRRAWPWVLLAAVLVAGAAALYGSRASRQTGASAQYVTEPVTRGTLRVTVTANGALQPTLKVNVGSELSGTVARVHVEVNDRVRRGQVLAELDTDKLRDQTARSEAALRVAQARVRQAQATRAEAGAQLARLREVSRLSAGQVPSQAEMSSAEAAVARAEAEQASAEAAVADAQAARSVDQTNLRKAFIRSPVDGVVLSRSVDPGNAVAASLQAVTLFTLAEDLRQLKLDVNVDEADVGRVAQGQAAHFTVSAYPNREYPAQVRRVAFGSTIKDNVVTYVAELGVGNDDLTLRPGMTATAVIVAAERRDVLLVPNAALRYAPETANAAQDGASLVSRLMPRPPGQGQPRKPGVRTSAARQVWVLSDGQPLAVPVEPGASDGRLTEVKADGLQPGMAVIVDQARAGAPR